MINGQNHGLFYSRLDLIGKEFQLEEREDKDSSVTALWLGEDGSVQVGITDGPPLQTAAGSWSVNEDLKGVAKGENAFRMTLLRTYEGGEHTGQNQAGNFAYNVRREFWGDIDTTGNFVSVSGTIHGEDESKGVDCEVGYFSLLDGAAEGGRA